jgi:hypothetical protein
VYIVKLHNQSGLIVTSGIRSLNRIGGGCPPDSIDTNGFAVFTLNINKL